MAASSSVSSIHASPWMALPLPPAAARTSCQTLMWPHSSELQASSWRSGPQGHGSQR